MDLFIDKLAQKIASTDNNKSVSSADMKENEILKSKIEGYEKLLQDMRLINLKNIESANKLGEVIAECKGVTSGMSDVVVSANEAANAAASAAIDASSAVTAVAEATDAAINAAGEAGSVSNDVKEYIKSLEEKSGSGKADDDLFEKTSDVIHRENVKVYRNVQKSIEVSLEDQTKAILEAQNECNKKNNQVFLKVMSVLIFLAVLADIALKVLGILGIL